MLAILLQLNTIWGQSRAGLAPTLSGTIAEIRFTIVVGPRVAALRKLRAAPEGAIFSGALLQQLPTGRAAKCLGRNAIIVSEPCLATLVVPCAVPVKASGILGTDKCPRTHRAAKTFVRFLRGFAILVEQTGLAFGKSRAAPERPFLAIDPAQRFVTLGTIVLACLHLFRGWFGNVAKQVLGHGQTPSSISQVTFQVLQQSLIFFEGANCNTQLVAQARLIEVADQYAVVFQSLIEFPGHQFAAFVTRIG